MMSKTAPYCDLASWSSDDLYTSLLSVPCVCFQSLCPYILSSDWLCMFCGIASIISVFCCREIREIKRLHIEILHEH